MKRKENKKHIVETLLYCASLCETSKAKFKHDAYNAACDDIKIKILASISRVRSGDPMRSYCVCQKTT